MDRSSQQSPGYRPPVAAGQVYPTLGYSDTGAPLFTYDDRERALAGPAPPAPPPVPPALPPPPEPDNRRNLAIGFAAVLVLVLVVVVGFRTFGGTTEEPVTRADPPATQSTNDPYLEGLPTQPESSVPRDPEAGGSSGSSTATVVYEVESGPATILYVDGDRVQIVRSSGTWTKTVEGSQRRLLRVSIFSSTDDPASCSITVDGKKVADESSRGASSSTGMLTCQFQD